ncbi:MAG: hypothetical protein Q4F65_10675 [Propionibacteriaceae bacterium]|nr:hypothetical protein [Propionibacteriaceae bacterium]
MLDNLLRLREPAAWILIAVAAVSSVLAVVRFVLRMSSGVVPLPAAAQDVALEALSLSLLLAVIAVVIACVFQPPPVAGARRIVLAAAVVVTIGTALTIVGALGGVSASAGTLAVVLELLGGLLDIVLKVVGTVTLWLIHRGLSAGRIEGGPGRASGAVLAGEPAAATAVTDGDADADDAVKAPEKPQPTWTPDAASGSVWTSASDAAAGARPSAYGAPGEASGWRPAPRAAGGDVPELPADGDGAADPTPRT